MKPRILLCLFVIPVFFSSCGGDQKSGEGVFFQDFDNMVHWTRDQRGYGNIAYSGLYSAKLDSSIEYSLTYELPYNYVLQHKYKKVTVSCQTYTTGPTDGLAIVLSIDGANKSYLWSNKGFDSAQKGENSWGLISFETKLPENVPADAVLKVYGWNTEKRTGFIDDVNIVFE